MTCCKLAELLIDFVSHELAEDQHRLVEDHLRNCSCCATYLETYRTTIVLMRRLPDRPVPEELVVRLKAAWTQMHAPTTPEG